MDFNFNPLFSVHILGEILISKQMNTSRIRLNRKKELVFWNPSSTKVVTFIYVGTCLWYNPYYLYIILIFFVTFLYFRVICQIINGTRLLLDDPRGINILWWSMAILLQQLLVGTITISTLMVFFTLVSFTWISLFILDHSPAFLTFWWYH